MEVSNAPPETVATDHASETSSQDAESCATNKETAQTLDAVCHSQRELAIMGKASDPSSTDCTNENDYHEYGATEVQSRSFLFPSSFRLKRNNCSQSAAQLCTLPALGTSRNFTPEEYDVAPKPLSNSQFRTPKPTQSWNTKNTYYTAPPETPKYLSSYDNSSHSTSMYRGQAAYQQQSGSQVNQARDSYGPSEQPSSAYNSVPPPAPPQLYQHYEPYRQPEPLQQYYESSSSQTPPTMPYYSNSTYPPPPPPQQQQHLPPSQPYPPNQIPYILQPPPPPPAHPSGPYYLPQPPVYPQNPATLQQYAPPVGYPGRKQDPWQYTQYGPPSATVLLSPAEIEAMRGNKGRKISAARERLLAEQFAKISVASNIPIQSNAAHPLSPEEVLHRKQMRRMASAPISPVKSEPSEQSENTQKLQRASSVPVSPPPNSSNSSSPQTIAQPEVEMSSTKLEPRRSEVSTTSSNASTQTIESTQTHPQHQHPPNPANKKLGSRLLKKFMRSGRSSTGSQRASRKVQNEPIIESTELKVDKVQRVSTMPVSAEKPEPTESNSKMQRHSSEPIRTSRVDAYTPNADSGGWGSTQPVYSPLSSQFYDQYVRSDFAPKTRRYRALIVGITYRDFAEYISYLPGAKTDVGEVFCLLVGQFGFNPDNIRVMSDEVPKKGERYVEIPTKANIMEGMRWLREGAQSGDSLFFYFAGHGHLLHDFSGDELDSEYDQCLTPIDWKTAGYLEDDSIYEWLITRIPYGARLTCLIDACTSGTVCDLPFLYTFNRGSRREPEPPMPPRRVMAPGQRVGESVLFAGSADLQKAADIRKPSRSSNESYGLMTRAFIDAVMHLLKEQAAGIPRTFANLVHSVSQRVQYIGRMEGLEIIQEPQFSSSHKMDVDSIPFSL